MDRRLMAPIRRRLKMMFTRAVGRMVDPDTLLQTLQIEILRDEVLDGIEHLEGYGRTANPPDGFEAFCASFGGDRGHTVCISAFHRQWRLKGLARGEVALYDDQGQVIIFKRDKTIHIYGCDTLTADVGTAATITCPTVTVAAAAKVMLDTPLVELSGSLTVGGGLTMTGTAGSGNISTPGDIADGVRSMASDRQIYNGHNHPGDSGGTTGGPNQTM